MFHRVKSEKNFTSYSHQEISYLQDNFESASAIFNETDFGPNGLLHWRKMSVKT